MKKVLIAAAVAGAALLMVSGPADAQRGRVHAGWHGHSGWHGHGWRGRGWGGYRGWGWGAGAGFAAGALVGSALAAPYYYGGPGYYVYDEPGADAVGYCMQRFKSYDPQSGTYLGYDGVRHPCP